MGEAQRAARDARFRGRTGSTDSDEPARLGHTTCRPPIWSARR